MQHTRLCNAVATRPVACTGSRLRTLRRLRIHHRVRSCWPYRSLARQRSRRLPAAQCRRVGNVKGGVSRVLACWRDCVAAAHGLQHLPCARQRVHCARCLWVCLWVCKEAAVVFKRLWNKESNTSLLMLQWHTVSPMSSSGCGCALLACLLGLTNQKQVCKHVESYVAYRQSLCGAATSACWTQCPAATPTSD